MVQIFFFFFFFYVVWKASSRYIHSKLSKVNGTAFVLEVAMKQRCSSEITIFLEVVRKMV